jgi:nitronate monooxygenase
MSSPLAALSVSNPVIAAPMAGGPTTPDLVVAVAEVGSIGFLAGGYKTAELLAEQITVVRRRTPTFGVNLFAPNPVPVEPSAFRRYAGAIQSEADAYGLQVADAEPRDDDDAWAAKLDVLLSDPVPIVSFTFGIPEQPVIAAFRAAGTLTVQTVTTLDEARLADEVGVDVLAVQASSAGGHSGTLTPGVLPATVALPKLVAAIYGETRRPIIGAGGVATPAEVAAIRHAGAAAVMVGTILLRSDESGASAVHKAALADVTRPGTVVTRAFTGRPARGLTNEFIQKYEAIAPLGYPAIHYLTTGLRRAAAAAGNPELVNLWAGTGYRSATAEPAGTILTHLASAL